MKKLILYLTLVLGLALLAGCGQSGDGGDGKDNPGGDETGKFSAYKAGSYVAAMESGTYYMDATVYVAGISSGMAIAVDGTDISVEMGGLGVPIRVLILDGKAYYLNDDKKVYMVMPDAQVPLPEQTGVLDYTGIAFGKDGTGPVAGLAGVDDNAYAFEEFTVTENGTEASIRYYFKGNDLFAMEMTTGEDVAMTFVINGFSDEIPAGLMELPADYAEVDQAGFM